jgi:hypothetical protein
MDDALIVETSAPDQSNAGTQSEQCGQEQPTRCDSLLFYQYVDLPWDSVFED